MPALINPGNDQFSVINFLPHQECAGYSLKVAAKSAAGRRNPCYLKAILHAPGVFFLCRSFDSPKIYGVVADCIFLFFTPHHQYYGSPGGAAFGLAGILQSRYSYPRLGYHP
ncbi:ash family protein [Salmonella enterica]|nr:ash family protein [Salmonella enterica]